MYFSIPLDIAGGSAWSRVACMKRTGTSILSLSSLSHVRAYPGTTAKQRGLLELILKILLSAAIPVHCNRISAQSTFVEEWYADRFRAFHSPCIDLHSSQASPRRPVLSALDRVIHRNVFLRADRILSRHWDHCPHTSSSGTFLTDL